MKNLLKHYYNLTFLISTLVILPVNITIAQDNKNQTTPETSKIVVAAPRVSLEDPADTFSSPITQLRYEPLVDLQSRNFAEAQGDVSIRGGTFENSGFQLGASSLVDPQTGHYSSEIPVATEMLSSVDVLTGFSNSVNGFNATTGTLNYDWKKISTKGKARAGVGNNDLNKQEIYSGFADIAETSLGNVGFDLSLARSESSGTRENGDNNLNRANARFQLASEKSQTDIFVGRQNKEFQWPYLYAVKPLHDLLGSSGVESEDLRTDLAFFNHKTKYCEKSFVEVSSYYRKNRDDYEFDVSNKGLFNPFLHKTTTLGSGIKGEHYYGDFDVAYNGQFISDDIESTALVFGKYKSRDSGKVTVAPGYTLNVGTMKTLHLQAGATYDDNNRDPSRVSPLSKVTYTEYDDELGKIDMYGEYTQTSQVASYTALNSNPNAGLFRGNSELGREISGNSELGINTEDDEFKSHLAVFYRNTNNLTDWVYNSSILPYSSRAARNVDINTLGTEAVFTSYTEKGNVTLSYTYLNKDSDYGDETIDASFYALNFPKHRITFSLSTPIQDNISFRFDNEFRKQYSNSLRSSSDTTYFISSAGIVITGEEWLKDTSLNFVIDNLGNENFEEIPGVPGVGRTVAVVLQQKW